MSISLDRSIENKSSAAHRSHLKACVRLYRTVIPPHSAVLYCGPNENFFKEALVAHRWSTVDVAAGDGIVPTHATHVLWDYIIIAPELTSDASILYPLMRALRAGASLKTRILLNCFVRGGISKIALKQLCAAMGYETITTAYIPGIQFLASVCVHVTRLIISYEELEHRHQNGPSVSIIIPCRNEAGTVAELIKRLPRLGVRTEFLCIEGNSTDNTLQELYRVQKLQSHIRHIEVMVQTGKGKANAVMEACARATGEILIIFDGDMTLDPEAMTLFYEALITRRGDLINGSRFFLTMEKKAMRFLNWHANVWFARIFSLITGQHITDTLCGTKACWRSDYEKSLKLDAALWKRDPFGDFAWLMSASRWSGKIFEIPVKYRARKYGKPISHRFRYGIQLCGVIWYILTRRWRALSSPVKP